MKRKVILLLIPISLAAVLSFSLFDEQQQVPIRQDASRNSIIREINFHILRQHHYNILDINDDFSGKAFDAYLKRLDNTKYFLLQQDVEQLMPYRLLIDDEILNAAQIPLFEQSKEVMRKRVEQVAALCEEILQQPFDFYEEEYVELEGKKRAYCKNEAELREEWRKYLKYQALVRYHDKLQEKPKEAKSEADASPKNAGEIENEVREQLAKNWRNRFDMLKKQDDEDYYAEYLNAIMGVYGPHTEFYPPQDKENFDIDMSGQLEGIGAQLILDDGDIKVYKIVPGSASWKQKELEAGDIILKVGQGSEEPVSIVGWSTKDAVKLIRGKKGTEVRLTVRKPDGLIKTIPIIRDVVVLEESYAKSAVIQDKDSKKSYGLIHLPSFYADFSGKTNRNSGSDVKTELVKLKGQGVDGIILDLRNNGGGSLRDAVEMAGFFINKGPVVQVKNRTGNPIVHKDDKNGVVYDGPLVILVNKFSASASEILAAAMQDYGRAVIVGSPVTFGKGTVQRFFDLDYYIPAQFANLKPMGSIKLTIQKFYRITGRSTQIEGVVPDVILPDTYAYMPYGESDLDYVLPWDEVEPAGYKKWELSSGKSGEPFNPSSLAKSSAKRLKKEPLFDMVEQNARRMKEQRDDTYQTLHYEKFKKQQDALVAASEKFKDLTRVHEDIEVVGTAYDMEVNASDTIRLNNLREWFKDVRKDIYLYEATRVLTDVVQ